MRKGRTYVLPKEAACASHLFLAKLTSGRGTVDGVLCSLTLPGNHREKITFDFFPTVRQAEALQFTRTFAVSGTYRSSDLAYFVKSSEVWSTGISHGFNDGISYISNFQGSPQEMEITTLLDKRIGRFISRGVFRLSECPVINAASIISRSYTGNVRVKRVVIPSFSLKAGVRLEFKYHFDSSEKESGDTSTSQHLAAEFRTTKRIPLTKFSEIKDDFDQFLRLASLAARYRCICPSWNYCDDRAGIVAHYYQNLTLPKGKAPSFNDTLIDVSLFQRFIRKAYEFCAKSSQTDLLDNAIYALVNERATLEDRYTRLFSGLQSLLWFVYRTSGGRQIPSSDQRAI